MWYADPSEAPQDPAARRIAWADIFAEFGALELDLHERYGIDIESGVLRERTWRWLHLRITDLVSDPASRIGATLAANEAA